MAKTTKVTARPKRSKAEVEEEFAEIREEVTAAREASSAKAEEQLTLREAEVRQAVSGLSMEGVVEKISGLGLEVSKSLSDLSEKLVQEVNRLAAVREAVALEQKEIERLHKIDVAATALDQLVQDYGRQKDQLAAEIAAQRAAWEEEARQAERDRKEQEESLKKQRQRETEEYEYKKALERKKAQDRYEEETKQRENQNREKQEALEKSWREREAALKEREEELLRLRKEAEEFPARLRQESERAAAEAIRATEQRFEQQITLLKKDNETEKRVAELRIKTLEETLTRQSAQMESLQKQLDEAKRQVQDIAVRAIEGASGSRALAHINEIAMEQAKHRAPQG
jgi:DNA repair exonuclease SbcCD ATPase subunit